MILLTLSLAHRKAEPIYVVLVKAYQTAAMAVCDRVTEDRWQGRQNIPAVNLVLANQGGGLFASTHNGVT
jgi:hypothetical protein